jgi:addiction module HigA family antidote
MMQMKTPNHPGDIIRDCLDELGVNVTDGAKALGVTRAALSRVLNRKAAVSAEMAVRLEKAIGSTAGFWLRLQLNYDLAQVQARSGKIHARRLVTPVTHSCMALKDAQSLLLKNTSHLRHNIPNWGRTTLRSLSCLDIYQADLVSYFQIHHAASLSQTIPSCHLNRIATVPRQSIHHTCDYSDWYNQG